ncbi:hypothetical protein FJN16_13165 [Tannerella forsythia]|nr:hypothetical protein FJN16_13165 [Tannerella forsythia]
MGKPLSQYGEGCFPSTGKDAFPARGKVLSQRLPFVIPNAVRNLARKRKEILRFALNDKLMVNCQWLMVMPDT